MKYIVNIYADKNSIHKKSPLTDFQNLGETGHHLTVRRIHALSSTLLL